MSDENKNYDEYLSRLREQKHSGSTYRRETVGAADDFAAVFAAASAQKAEKQENINAAQGDTIVIGPGGREMKKSAASDLDVTKYRPNPESPLYEEDESFKAFFTGTIESAQFDDEPKRPKKKRKFFGGLFSRKQQPDEFDFDDEDDFLGGYDELVNELNEPEEKPAQQQPKAEAPKPAPAPQPAAEMPAEEPALALDATEPLPTAAIRPEQPENTQPAYAQPAPAPAAPQQPVYAQPAPAPAAPQQPAYAQPAPAPAAPQQPVYTQPAPAPAAPQQPAYAQPAPAPAAPQQPVYAQPAPAPAAPQQPVYAQPAPAPAAPQQPENTQPAPAPAVPQQPAYAQPVPAPAAPQQPAYAQPAPAPAAPQQPVYAQPAPAPAAPQQPVNTQPAEADVYVPAPGETEEQQTVVPFNPDTTAIPQNDMQRAAEEAYRKRTLQNIESAALADGFKPWDPFEEKPDPALEQTTDISAEPQPAFVQPEGDLFGVLANGEAAAAAAEFDVPGVSSLRGGTAAAAADIAAAIAHSNAMEFADEDDNLYVPQAEPDKDEMFAGFDKLDNFTTATMPQISVPEPQQPSEPQDSSGDSYFKPKKQPPVYLPSGTVLGDMPVQEYELREQSGRIGTMLAGFVKSLRLRSILLGVLGVLMLYFNLADKGFMPAFSGVSAQQHPFAFILFNIFALAAASLLCFATVRDGIKGLWDTETVDTLPALAVCGSALQLLVFLIGSSAYAQGSYTLFAPVAILLLFASTLGKMFSVRAAQDNFAQISADEDIAVAEMAPADRASRLMWESAAQRDPKILVSRPSGIFDGFIKQSFSQRHSDKETRRNSYILLGSAVVCAVLGAVFAGGFAGAFSCLAAVLCMGAPLAGSLLGAITDRKLHARAASCGAMVPGWECTKSLEQTNAVVVKDTDIFPEHCVQLQGIKTFQKERIDVAILYAASILTKSSPSLRGTFLGIIQGKTEMLYEAENLTADGANGYTAWIEHNRVLVGNRAMMEKNGVETPTRDFEAKYTKNGQYSPIYLAVSGKLFGMFIIGYHADQKVTETLAQLQARGCRLLVSTNNFTVTTESVCAAYGLSESSIKVLAGAEREPLDGLTTRKEQTAGHMCTDGSFFSLVGGMTAASAAASTERSACIVQFVAVIFSALLCLVLSVAKGLVGISLLAVLLYQLVWGAATLCLPLLKKGK